MPWDAEKTLPTPEFGNGTESGLNPGKLWYNGLVAAYNIRAGANFNLIGRLGWQRE